VQSALHKFKADIFKVLAHPTRIHIIELLEGQELTVSQLVERLGVEPSNASQHLAALRAKNLVSVRKEGNQVFYSLRDPLLAEVLNTMKRYFKAHLEENLSVIRQMESL
jgi:ArsR family transcriptional regulator